MKIRLSDYYANYIVKMGITQGFSVIGGGAMYLNDSFGHKKGLKMLYHHQEQAASIAAEAYARYNNKPALVSVTSGPGGTNALTGVVCAYLDSLPMIVISGQVRYDTCARFAKKTTGANLRSMGNQEYDITKSAKSMTKYAEMLEDPKDARYMIERAIYLATHGRKGPTWIDVPVNFQSAMIEPEKQKSYFGSFEKIRDDLNIPKNISDNDLKDVIELIKNAKRPVIYAGYGIRLAGAYNSFRKLIDKLNIPVATYWNAIDLIEDSHPLYVGRGGDMGDRPGNFAVQNADLVIAIGTRISLRQVGYNYKTWARAAKVVMVDIDKEEFKKHTIHVDKTVWADAKDFIEKFYAYVNKEVKGKVFIEREWNEACLRWKKKYPVVTKTQLIAKSKVNVYAFIKVLSDTLKDGAMVAVSNGACCVAGSQAFIIKDGTRFHNNNAIASMGYGLPAAIGACVSINNKETICLEGDGSIMMNLQELQTIITNKMPIKIFLINNDGYHSMRITQHNLFGKKRVVGLGPESKDVSFPDFSKVAEAFGYKYFAIKNPKTLKSSISKVLNVKGPIFVEVFTDTKQVWEPKSSAKKLKDGTLVSPPLEDLAPFLSEKELKDNMYIPLVSEC